MKIVCDNCATKYSIADEKVRGKVFKIRCKKCSHIIVVRGGEAAAADAGANGTAGFGGDEEQDQQTIAAGSAGAAPFGAGADAVWHLVIDREQVGPLTAQEVRAKFAAGEIDAETYSWREGFADWLRLGSIEDFRDLASGAPSQEDGATRRTDSADLFSATVGEDSGGHDAGVDLFGAAAAAAPAAASEAFSSGSAGLFGAPAQEAPAPSRPARTSSPGFGGAAAAAAAAEAGEPQMKGQRNENSVLFSLNNLQALASGGMGGGASASAGPEASSAPRPGFASSSTEGSGLIDIRAMAASTLAAKPADAPGASADDAPSFSAGPIFSPMAAPILMPAAPSGPPKWMWAVLGVGVLAVVLIIVVGILLLTRKPEVPPVVAANVPPAAAPGSQPVAAQPPVAQPPAAQPAAAEPPKAADDDEKKRVAAAPKAPKASPAPRADRGSKASSASPSGVVPPPSETAPAAAPKRSGKRDELDDLLNSASPDKPAPRAERPSSRAAAVDDSLPDQLDKGAIVAGMGKVKGRVASCYEQYKVPGMANVQVTIARSGTVSSASVSGSFAGTPTGSCVEKAVKGATFGKFKGAPMTLTYPFMLR